MKRLITILVMISAAVLLRPDTTPAQCSMHGKRGGGEGGSTKAESGLTKTATKVADSNEKLIADFADLHGHFAKMMEMDDPEELKKEMKKHDEMMSRLHEKMIDQQKDCREMVSKAEDKSEQAADQGGGHDH